MMYEYVPVDKDGREMTDAFGQAARMRFLKREDAESYAKVMRLSFPYYRVDAVRIIEKRVFVLIIAAGLLVSLLTAYFLVSPAYADDDLEALFGEDGKYSFLISDDIHDAETFKNEYPRSYLNDYSDLAFYSPSVGGSQTVNVYPSTRYSAVGCALYFDGSVVSFALLNESHRCIQMDGASGASTVSGDWSFSSNCKSIGRFYVSERITDVYIPRTSRLIYQNYYDNSEDWLYRVNVDDKKVYSSSGELVYERKPVDDEPSNGESNVVVNIPDEMHAILSDELNDVLSYQVFGDFFFAHVLQVTLLALISGMLGYVVFAVRKM